MYGAPGAVVDPGFAFADAAFAMVPGACCEGCWMNELVGGGTPGGGFKCE